MDDKSTLAEERMALYEVVFGAFLTNTGMQVTHEVGDGWCGYRCCGKLLSFHDTGASSANDETFVLAATFLANACAENCGDLAERLARESIKNDTKGQAAKPSIAIDDSSEDEQERKPKRKKELAPFERKVEGLKKSMHERSVAISAAVKTHPSGSLPYASGAWFDSEFLRTLAFAKGVTCFLVVEGRLDVAVYTPTFQRDY